MKTGFERYRIFITRIVAFLSVVVLVFSSSVWDEKDPLVAFILFLAGIFLVAVAALGRMWCSLYIAGYKNNKLVTEGPYSIVRNPLYFFSLLGAVGVGFATETVTFPAVVLIMFSLYYPFVIKKEEERLSDIFGDEFAEYKKRVPVFFPNLKLFKEPETYIVKPAIYRGHMFSALWFVWFVGLIEILEGLKDIGVIRPLYHIL